MLSKKMETAINNQINAELYSAYFYLNMSAYCEEKSLPGFANWLNLQAQEEYAHAMKFYNYLHDRDGKVILDQIDKPKSGFKNILDVFEQVLEHEKKVTAMINNLYTLAVKENDYPSQVMLQWFIGEQVEEEKTAKEIVDQLKWVGDKSTALFMLDQKFGRRLDQAAEETSE
ncbi:MAG: ferritin [Calditrichaceae bacterium]|nr:ferritin [Calditrichaceae bacterium]MBN2710167.1 ferritin [Calditrichaceae bacterium]RQV94143.1 MAG: ferritin [Calditrichota bacterium]